ncbi:NUDIX hydrolase domain-like protein [Pleurostoma richardsiae]|uniref:NUDIX hydrolase domain-like protein n=1 Tax=Pleurostoma richardsiae TaxID=41990 RepID=A0AA38VBL0_9PEZI|nr:NUDIX hydrolase domain-like protein [Pleurostoma richardsiae]
MVSQPDQSTSLTIRGPSSVVGASSTGGRSHHHLSRSRRYNRSHAGGTSYVPQNEFPWFSNSGDVEIVVRVASGHENRYLLHRHTLTRCSGFFEASTSNEWSRGQALPQLLPASSSAPTATTALPTGGELARIGEDSGSERGGAGSARPSPLGTPKRRWRYELDPGTGDGDIPMLVQKDELSGSSGGSAPPAPNSLFGGSAPSSSSRKHSHSTSHSSSHSFFRSVANLSLTSSSQPPLPPPSQAEQDLLRDYDNLFRIMYNYPPILDGINIADAYVQCKSLLTLADQYDALAVVGPRVDHHLLQFQSRLWKQVAKYPISYLRLGYLARSRIIFQEALIHVVGQWPAGERSLRAALPEAVLDIIEDKVDELEETVARVEGRLFRLNLTTRSGERVTPATSYLDWLAVSLFRQWLADNTTPAPIAVPERRGGGGSSRDAGLRATRGGSSSGESSRHNHGGTGGALVAASATPPLASLGRTFRALGSPGGAAFLGHDECKRFLKLTPELYSRDNLRRFEKRVNELKAMAREVVRPLMGSGLELEMMGGSGGGGGGGGGRVADGIGYLTCTRVTDRDLPWSVDD